ncbi:MAG: PAS domain S-box protein [Gammaproteobacteria bacterium]|nr:PAS domain S-box protein [Gammaproteobacteria bacterium]
MSDTGAQLPTRASAWPMFAGLFVALTLLLGAVVVVHFYIDYRAERTRRDTNETLNVELARRALVADITGVTTDLMFLGRLLESLNFDPQTAEGRRRFLAEVFVTFAREKQLYDQIRFIDLRGREVVRVNLGRGGAELVAPDALQEKGGRYYVKQGLQLDRGQVYLSPLDLNVEDGIVEQPAKPVLRFATPVFDIDGRRQGLVVLNYLGDRLLERFRQAAANIADHVQLLNDDGYWLSSPRRDEAWGFMFGRDVTFARRFPAAWRLIRQRGSGQQIVDAGMFTFATVRPAVEVASAPSARALPPLEGPVWRVVSHVRLDAAALGLGPFIARHAGLYLGILGLLALLAYLVAHANYHRRAAEGQRAYEQRFRQTLEDIDLAALMVDIRGRLTFCNHYLLDLTGWRRDEVIGSDWVERFVPVEQRDAVQRVLERLDRFGELPPEFEGEVVTRAGERRLIAWNNTPARDARGHVVGLTAIGEDITERRRAEEEVRKLSQAVQQSPAIVQITDRNGNIEYVNPKFTEVTGYRFDEVRGRNPSVLKSGETPPSEYRALWQALTTGGEWRGEFHNRRKDGSLYWEAAAISALRDADGQITHFLAVKEDITERKRLQREVDARSQELARAQALAAMGQMATMLAHDLRNPLSSVKMAVQMLGKQVQTQQARETVAIGQEQVRYMEDIITDMLTYARPGELKTTWLDAEKLVTGVIGTVRRRIAEYEVHVSATCPPGLPTFPGDASKLRQLLSNLLVNALQAAAVRPVGGREVRLSVELVMHESGRQICFRVCDNGDGIDPEVRDRLFEPFVTTRTKGTGLGLAIVRQIADLHAAAVALTPNPPHGTCAIVQLPLTPANGELTATDDGDRVGAGVRA